MNIKRQSAAHKKQIKKWQNSEYKHDNKRVQEQSAEYKLTHKQEISKQNDLYISLQGSAVKWCKKKYYLKHKEEIKEKNRARCNDMHMAASSDKQDNTLTDRLALNKSRTAVQQAQHTAKHLTRAKGRNIHQSSTKRTDQGQRRVSENVRCNVSKQQFTVESKKSTSHRRIKKRQDAMMSNKYNRQYRMQLKERILAQHHERRLIKIIIENHGRTSTPANKTKKKRRRSSIFSNAYQKMKIQLVVRSAVAVRSKISKAFTNIANSFQSTMREWTDKCPAVLNESTITEMIGGKQSHTSHTEPYFYDTAYRPISSNVTLVIDENGIVQNVHTIEPIAKDSKGVQWPCGSTCVIRQTTIDNVGGFVQLASSANKKDLQNLFQNIDACYSRGRDARRRGHPITCIDTVDCPSSLRHISELACHYTSLSQIKKRIYDVKKYSDAIRDIDQSLSTGDLDNIKLTLFVTAQLVSKPLNKENELLPAEIKDHTLERFSEEHILQKYSKGLAAHAVHINNFHDTPCACCERLHQKNHLANVSKFVSKDKFNNAAWLQLQAYWLTKYDTFESDTDLYETLFVCRYCTDCVNKDLLPARCALNGLDVDELPDSLKHLNLFETMLLQKSKCFQTVVRLGPVKHRLPHSEKVLSVKGRVIYLPLPLEENNNMLPKGLAPNHELHVLVNGVPTKNKTIWQDIVRVDKLKAAMETLIEINPLYKDLVTSTEDLERYVYGVSEQEPALNPGPDALLERVSSSQSAQLYQHYSIHPIHADQPTDQMQAYKLKACSGQPLSIWDKNLDLMCFPDLFPRGRCGMYEPVRFTRMSAADFRVSRLSNMNARFRRNQQYLFHLLYDSDIKNLSNSISHMLRQNKPGLMTVEQVMNMLQAGNRQLEANLSSLFGNIRGTRQYWFKRQMEVSCMMREYGPPTWFVTLSCAEYSWDNLHDHLVKMNSDLPGVDKMTPGELCTADPVSVCRHYHARIHSIINNLILAKDAPVFGEIVHFFWRVEYQCRGAAHYHLLLWSKDAPLIGTDSDDTILKYIEQYVTCSMPDEIKSPTLYKYVTTFQKHKCSDYCMRTYKTDAGASRKRCRFGFPRAVKAHATLNDAFSSMRHRQKGKSSKRLYELKRTEAESRTNDYNPALLLALGANVDVQYIGESSWSLAKYVTSYITKAEKVEMEQLWGELTDKSLSSRLWTIGLKALTHRQCGAYEATDRLLGTRLYGKSANIRFCNTHEPHQRNRLLKTYAQLQEMHKTNPDSESIYTDSYIDNYYPCRPDCLEQTSLFDFLSQYDRMPASDKVPAGWLKLKDERGLLRRKIKPYLINHYQHNPKKSSEESEKYFHALLMLFLPWRNEDELKVGCATYQEMFQQKKDELQAMMSHHNKLTNIIEADEVAQEKLVDDTPPTSQPAQLDDPSNAMCGHEHNEAENVMTEITTAMQQARMTSTTNDVNNTIKQLNIDQKRIFDKLKSSIEKEEPIQLFVTGCGGTGKSFLIAAISQWLNSMNTDKVAVTVAAPTGLAAYNVGGVTIHRLLMLPIEHGSTARYEKLGSESSSSLRHTLGELKLLIIDEISMISSLLLTYIHLRLTEITGKQALFGGINILILGDILQLNPIQGNPPYIKVTADEVRTKLESIGAVDLWNAFDYDELTINVRQSSDESFSSLLSRARVGALSVEDKELLRTRLIGSRKNHEDATARYLELVADGQHPVCLVSKLDSCSNINNDMLNKLGATIVHITSIDTIDATNKSTKVP
jgi:ATP-dependent DNA helicase PIF1